MKLLLQATLVILMAFHMLPAPTADAQSGSLEITASEDATVKSATSSRNYGDAANVISSNYSSNEQYAYLKFDLSQLHGQRIDSATLVVTPNLARNVQKNVYTHDPSLWTEDTINWNSKPRLAPSPIGQLPTTTTVVGQELSINLDPSAVQSFAGETIGLTITNSSSRNTLDFSSSESFFPPVLRITVSGETEEVGQQPTSADVNGDGRVNAEDYRMVLEAFDSSNASVDIDGNGIVNIFDLNRVITTIEQGSFNTPTPSPNPSPTDEPEPIPDPTDEPTENISGIWLGSSEINRLPQSGAAWENVLSWAQQDTSSPNIANQNDNTDAAIVAKALVYARTGQARYRNEVIHALETAQNIPLPQRSVGALAVARNLAPYAVAADLVGYRTQRFENWLVQNRDTFFSGAGPTHNMKTCHEERPTNWGTHCGTSRIAVDLYLNDRADLEQAANVFHGFVGNQEAYDGFRFGSDLSWQCNPNNPVGINPQGCTINGRNADGIIPDDQRRGGRFSWPPAKENYVWEALQGLVAQAWMLHRQGYPAFEWEDRALLRSMNWLHTEADFPAEGDDTGTPWIINKMYNASFPTTSASPGKNGMGFYDWTHR